MKLHEILHQKGHQILTITEDLSVLEAARTLAEENVGSLVVVDNQNGKFTITRSTANDQDADSTAT